MYYPLGGPGSGRKAEDPALNDIKCGASRLRKGQESGLVKWKMTWVHKVDRNYHGGVRVMLQPWWPRKYVIFNCTGEILTSLQSARHSSSGLQKMSTFVSDLKKSGLHSEAYLQLSQPCSWFYKRYLPHKSFPLINYWCFELNKPLIKVYKYIFKCSTLGIQGWLCIHMFIGRLFVYKPFINFLESSFLNKRKIADSRDMNKAGSVFLK